MEARILPDPEWAWTLYVQGERELPWELRFASAAERDRWATALHQLQRKYLERLVGAALAAWLAAPGGLSKSAQKAIAKNNLTGKM
eukprot:COSAG02_NODE_65272_length_258_cov_0.962264_1_plen_85_part_11